MSKKQDLEQIARYADMLSAMGTEPRLHIMRLLLSAHPQGLVVGEIGGELEIPSSTLSHHLEKLKNEGLVVASAEVAHRYLAADAKVFVQEVSALIKTGTTLDAAQVPQLKKTRRAAAPAWARDQQPE